MMNIFKVRRRNGNFCDPMVEVAEMLNSDSEAERHGAREFLEESRHIYGEDFYNNNVRFAEEYANLQDGEYEVELEDDWY